MAENFVTLVLELAPGQVFASTKIRERHSRPWPCSRIQPWDSSKVNLGTDLERLPQTCVTLSDT